MAKKNPKAEDHLIEDNKGVQAVQNQLFESYQSGVVEDQLKNNRNINTFNNQKK